jgi:5-methylcytosine-specific restriction endonuclease McrA
MPARLKRWRPPRPAVRPSKERAHYTSADWRARRLRILIRDAYTCRACGRVVTGQAAHVDHIRPLEEGGTDDDANLQVLCESDHGRKTREEQRKRGHLGP